MSESEGKAIPNSDLTETSKDTKKPLGVSSVNEDKVKKERSTDQIQKAGRVDRDAEIEKYADTYLEIMKEQYKQELIIKEQLNVSPLKNINSPQEIANFAEILVKAKMCPFKDPADATIALIAGKELGLSLAATLQGIHPIEGKPSLGVHIKKGILLQNNVLFKRVRDMEDYFEYVDFDAVAAKNAKEKNLKYTPELIGYGYLNDIEKFKELATKECRKRKIDIRTEYLFTRYFKTPKGVIKNTATGIFSVSEAQNAELMDKNNWKKYLRDMLASRAFSRGANEIADDLLHGLYSFSELADINDSVSYYIDEAGHEQIIS